jgi:hypothetical protein
MEELILTRLRNGHTRLTYKCQFHGEEARTCAHSEAPLRIRHILTDWPIICKATYRTSSGIAAPLRVKFLIIIIALGSRSQYNFTLRFTSSLLHNFPSLQYIGIYCICTCMCVCMYKYTHQILSLLLAKYTMNRYGSFVLLEFCCTSGPFVLYCTFHILLSKFTAFWGHR